jgi:hypothetical protein
MTNTDWLTLALVLITAFYAWATFKILRANEGVVAAMREQTEAQLRPYVVVSVSVRIGTTLLLLDIQNTGKSPAVDLRLKMDKDFFFNGEKTGKNLANLSVFTQQIDALAPGAQIQFVMGVGHTIFADGIDESLCPKVFTVHADYAFGEQKYSERNTIDLRPMLHSSVIQNPVADELKGLRESLEKALKK